MFKSYTISRMLSGGETMKTLFLVLALALTIVGACVADSVTVDVYSGWNLVGLPLVPLDHDPAVIFSDIADLDYNLSKWDPSTGGVPFTFDAPEEFGMCLLGDGFWLMNTGAATVPVTYDGVANGVPDSSGNKTDMWISLPGSGNSGAWHMVGVPFNNDIMCDDGNCTGGNIMFTNGTALLDWDAAFREGWVNDRFTGWNASGGGFDVSYNGETEDDTLRAGHGYWVQTYVPNIAMILPAYPVEP